jgi:hypothetical protein
MVVRWTGFADLTFEESAWLAFAHAAEHAETDAHEGLLDAWVIEDRRLLFSVETATSRPVLEAIKRMVNALVLQAVAGEAILETGAGERWAWRPSVGGAPSDSKEIVIGCELFDSGETIPAEAIAIAG